MPMQDVTGAPNAAGLIQSQTKVAGQAAQVSTPTPVEAARTGISNVTTPEGQAAMQQALLDLGLNMPEFLSPQGEKYIAGLSASGQGTLKDLGKAVGALTTNVSTSTSPNAGVMADVQGRWADFVSGLRVNGGVDVNALVQAVLREAYMENTQDLHFYAQKVRFYNQLKKMIRDEVTKAREYLAKQAGKKPEEALVGGPYTNSVGSTGPLQFPTEPAFDAKTGAMVPHPPLTNDDVTADKAIPMSKKEELETYIKNLEEKLNSVGDDAQLANVDLQNMLQKQQQTLQMMSNISKMLHDTAMAIIRKIAG